MSDDDAVARPVIAPADSILGRIKARRDERLAEQHLDLPIPTWNGDLVARYRVLDRSEVERVTKRGQAVQRNPSSDRNPDRDLLISACVGLFSADDDGDLAAVVDDSGSTVGYGEALAQILGVTAGSAREVVGYLFADNDLAISAHALKVFEWMQDTSTEVEGALMGEARTPGS